MYKHRHIELKLKQYLNHFKVVLVVGARQVGKTTLLKNMLTDRQIITFDPVQDLYNARKDPDLFLENFPKPIILDEIQYAPELLPAIKRVVDQNDSCGQYVLTGSHNLSLLKSVSESLAGRIGIVKLGGMTIYENQLLPNSSWLELYLTDSSKLLNTINMNLNIRLYDTLWKGSYPAITNFDNNYISGFFSSYVQTYVERDVRIAGDLKDLGQFSTFLSLMANLTAQEINASHLGREISITHNTAQKWLEILKATYIYSESLPYYGNTIKRLSKKRKGYISDTGLACYLMRITSPETLASYPFLGAIFETYCYNMLNNVAESLSLKPNFYHWRTNGGAEVDLVMELDNKLYPIEFKCKTNLTSKDNSGIKAFKDTYNNSATGLIIYAGDKSYKTAADIIALPWDSIVHAQNDYNVLQ